MIFLDADAIRIVFEFYARDRYRANSWDGSDASRALLQVFADNKIVEDVHQPLRMGGRANVNKKMAHRHIEDLMFEAQVLENRGIRNPCRVTRDVWCNDYDGARRREVRRRGKSTHLAHRRNLPKRWGTIMKPYSRKPWATLNENTLQRAAAAWNWLHYYVAKRGEGRGEGLPELQKIGDGLLSKFAPDAVILKPVPSSTVLASLGNRTWAALGLPLQKIFCKDKYTEGDDDVSDYISCLTSRSVCSTSPRRLKTGMLFPALRIVAPPTALT